MEIKSLRVLSDASNYAVLFAPGRQFPGSVVQGDSLSILLGNAETILSKVKHSPDEELVGCAEELVMLLKARLEHYEQVLKQYDLKLPYNKPSD